MIVLIVFSLVLVIIGGTRGAITLDGVTCGREKKCNLEQYCSEFDFSCKSCVDICDLKHHNFDASLCVKDCQDYLHNLRYMKKDDNAGTGNENLRGTVQRLSHMVTITLTLMCFILLVLVLVLGFQLYRWKIKKNVTLKSLKSKLFKQSGDDSPNKVNNMSLDTAKPDLRLEINTVTNPRANSHSSQAHSPVTHTTSISRRPAEDSTLNYAAYDNHAMSGSPSRNNESRF